MQPCESNGRLTRREMLRRGGMGFGSLGAGATVGRRRFVRDDRSRLGHPPARPQAASLRRQGETPSSTFRQRRSLARRYVRSKPELTRRWPGAADQSADRAQDRRRPSLRHTRSRSTARAASRSASCSAHVAESIDDIAVIRSMHGDSPNHEPSLMLMNCGEARLIRPSMGSWLTYGLGTENQNLPGFIAMCPGGYPIRNRRIGRPVFCLVCIKARTSTPSTPRSSN